MKVYARVLKGKEFKLQGNETRNLRSIKKAVYNKYKLPPHQQIIRFNGRSLDSSETLKKIGIRDGDKIDVDCRINGGFGFLAIAPFAKAIGGAIAGAVTAKTMAATATVGLSAAGYAYTRKSADDAARESNKKTDEMERKAHEMNQVKLQAASEARNAAHLTKINELNETFRLESRQAEDQHAAGIRAIELENIQTNQRNKAKSDKLVKLSVLIGIIIAILMLIV